MATLKLTNNASSLLSAGIDATQTSIAITSGDEGRFPTLGAGEWFPLTVVDNAGNREVMRCTARSGVTLTVVRAQEGTTGISFSSGARADLRLTAGAFMEHTTDIEQQTTGEIPDARLPERLQEDAPLALDADAIAITGYYRTDGDTDAIPVAAIGYLTHQTIDADTMQQGWQSATTLQAYSRRRVSGTWSSWVRVDYEKRGLPPGAVLEWPGVAAPTGWLLLHGQVVTVADYPEMCANIYCGDSANATAVDCYRTTSNTVPASNRSTSGQYMVLPDDRGVVIAGKDNMGGSVAGRLTVAGSGLNGTTLGAVGGAETHTLSQAQTPLKQHNHGVTDPGHNHYIDSPFTVNAFAIGGGGPPASYSNNSGGSLDWNSNTNTTGISIQNASSDSATAHNNVQPTRIRNKIIKT